MQSSYRVIKNNDVLSAEEKSIVTEYTIKYNRPEFEDGSQICTEAINLDEYRAMADKIIKAASSKRDTILSESNIRAIEIEKEAYQKGYEQGNANGYEDGHKEGYNEAYDKNIDRAREEATNIVENANSILMNAKNEYEAYMFDRKIDIINLAMEIAENVTRKQLQVAEGITHMIDEVIEQSKSSKSFVIKCNEIHVDELKNRIEVWKQTYAQDASIFVIPDELMESGNAIIEKDNGKTTVGIDIGFEKIREGIF